MRHLPALAAAALSCLLAGLVAPVAAQPAPPSAPCGDRDAILGRLAERYAETPVAAGLSSRGALVEVTRSSTGSWTLLVTLPDGPTCILMVGEAMEMVEPVGPAPGADS